MKSIQFKSSDPTKRQAPISLRIGMEREYEFSEGNQVEGERIYIFQTLILTMRLENN